MVHDIDNIHYESLDDDEEYEGLFEFESPSFEGNFEGEGILDEDEEMALAAELLNVSDDEELEQFFGKIFKKAKRWGKKINRATGGLLGKALRKVAKKALPVVGGALGNFIVPGAGGLFGAKLASQAGKMFGLELEGMDSDEQEFEVARKFVRFASQAAADAADNEAFMSPHQAVRQAMASSARRYAPGLYRTSGRNTRGRGHKSNRSGSASAGRWVRQGRNIILTGA